MNLRRNKGNDYKNYKKMPAQQFCGEQDYLYQTGQAIKEKRRKHTTDSDFAQVLEGFVQVLTDMNKIAKFEHKKKKKYSRQYLQGNEHFENQQIGMKIDNQIRKKVKLSNDDQLPGEMNISKLADSYFYYKRLNFLEQLEYLQQQKLAVNSKQNIQQLSQMDDKTKKGLYRFKDELTSGTGELQNLNILLQKEVQKQQKAQTGGEVVEQSNQLLKNYQKNTLQFTQDQIYQQFYNNPKLMAEFIRNAQMNAGLDQTPGLNQVQYISQFLGSTFPEKSTLLENVLGPIGMNYFQPSQKPMNIQPQQQQQSQVQQQLQSMQQKPLNIQQMSQIKQAQNQQPNEINLQNFIYSLRTNSQLRTQLISNPQLMQSLIDKFSPQQREQLVQFLGTYLKNCPTTETFQQQQKPQTQQNQQMFQNPYQFSQIPSSIFQESNTNQPQPQPQPQSQPQLKPIQFYKQNLPIQIQQQIQPQSNVPKEIQSHDSIFLKKQQKKSNFKTPFKRAATHVAIAYFIFIKSFENVDLNCIEKDKFDPTYNAKKLRDRKNSISQPFAQQQTLQSQPQIQTLLPNKLPEMAFQLQLPYNYKIFPGNEIPKSTPQTQQQPQPVAISKLASQQMEQINQISMKQQQQSIPTIISKITDKKIDGNDYWYQVRIEMNGQIVKESWEKPTATVEWNKLITEFENKQSDFKQPQQQIQQQQQQQY